MDAGEHHLPQLDGRPDHPDAHTGPRRPVGRRVRRAGRRAGGGRAVRHVGARGRLRRRAAPAGQGRRAAGRRRGALRGDQAAAAQRRPSGPVLFRLPGRIPRGARGRAGSGDRGIPCPLHGFGGDADAAADARPGRLPRRPHPPLRQRLCGRPGGPAVRGLLRPHPEVAVAGGARQPALRRPGAAVRGDRRELGSLRRGRRRTGPPDRGGGPARRHPGAARPLAARESGRVSCQPCGVRRPDRRTALPRGLPVGPGLAAPARRARDVAGADRGRRVASLVAGIDPGTDPAA